MANVKILSDEIAEYFATLKEGSIRNLSKLPNEFPGIVIRKDMLYGVAIEIDDTVEVKENFTSATIFTEKLRIGNEIKNYLILACSNDDVRIAFADVCSNFLKPGTNGVERIELLNNPYSWWEKWRDLLGNAISTKKSYSVLGEMMGLDILISKKYDNVNWSATKDGTHDIETVQGDFEVKSTLKKYKSELTVASQYQLQTGTPLKLMFFRFEEAMHGFSINELVESLVKKGYDKNLLEYSLKTMGFEKGCKGRNDKFKVLEQRLYKIDEKFPKITDKSFKGDQIPNSVISIVYTIDLNGLKYEKLVD